MLFVVSSILVKVLEKRTDTFTVMVASDGLGEESADIKHDELGDATSFLLGNRERVGDNNAVDLRTTVKLLQSITAKETVCGNAIDRSRSTTLHSSLCSSNPGTRLVHDVVNDKDWLARDVSDQGDGVLELGVM